MPEKKTIERAKKAKREHLSPSTQAGEFVREEIEHIREGKHGARSTEQAIAIGLSKARRAGVDLPVPEKGEASESTRKAARRDLAKGRKGARKRRFRPSGRARASADCSVRAQRRVEEGARKHARKAARKRTRGRAQRVGDAKACTSAATPSAARRRRRRRARGPASGRRASTDPASGDRLPRSAPRHPPPTCGRCSTRTRSRRGTLRRRRCRRAARDAPPAATRASACASPRCRAPLPRTWSRRSLARSR